MLIQLDLFEQDENVLMRKEIAKVRESSEKVRKGIFARHNELARLWLELDHRLAIIERCICKGVIE